MAQKSTRRCSICGISWPNLQRFYGQCPKCGEETDIITNPGNDEVLSAEEGVQRINHINFERHLNGEPLLPAPNVSKKIKDALAKREQFDRVIKGAGYSSDELKELERLAAGLGRARWEEDDDEVSDSMGG